MKFQGAVIEEQGVKFSIVIVKKHVLDSPAQSERAMMDFSRFFPGLPIVLMAQDSRGVPSYRGRDDIAKFLASVHPSRIPWQEFTVS